MDYKTSGQVHCHKNNIYRLLSIFFFFKLSLVKITPFIKNQINILILSGNFNFHNNLFKGIAIWLIYTLIALWKIIVL